MSRSNGSRGPGRQLALSGPVKDLSLRVSYKVLYVSRVFVLWLHYVYGLRDQTRSYGEELSCDRDGYFAELITPYDVTQQVMKILQVMERPLVSQRNQRIVVFSDVYAHVEVRFTSSSIFNQSIKTFVLSSRSVTSTFEFSKKQEK